MFWDAWPLSSLRLLWWPSMCRQTTRPRYKLLLLCSSSSRSSTVSSTLPLSSPSGLNLILILIFPTTTDPPHRCLSRRHAILLPGRDLPHSPPRQGSLSRCGHDLPHEHNLAAIRAHCFHNHWVEVLSLFHHPGYYRRDCDVDLVS